jgi:DNA (cytosine-5)-methyltransferase 1
MRYLSVCSGIEAASVAWHPLGWTPAAFSEIEAFPRAVLSERWPSVPLHGDFTTISGSEYGPIDLLVGGTPCQSFSVAGLRKGLADERGNLALEFLKLADRTRARWVVWENVPGVLSSSGGRDFGAFLGGLVELGYGFAYRVLDAQYIRVDGYARAVPQRRRRVFVVGHLGDWRRAAAVLFERESLSGHPAPRRETRERAAPTLAARTRGGGGLGTDFDCDGGLVAGTLSHNGKAAGSATSQDAEAGLLVAHSLLGKANSSHDETMETYVAHSLRADGFDASEDGTGRGTPIIAIQDEATRGNPQSGPGGKGWRGDGASFTHQADHVQAVAFQSKASAHQSMNPSTVAPTLDVGKHDGLAVAFKTDQDPESHGDICPTLQQPSPSGGGQQHAVMQGLVVRRLTPRECERLQGFDDDYTLVTHRKKSAADGPRYKALGNSMAVNCMRWIGRRIAQVEAL